MNQIKTIRIGAIAGGTAVALGAFGAHGLQQLAEAGTISADQIKTFETAVRYQMYHALALLIIPALNNVLNEKFSRYTANCFLFGILLFSGSLYFYSLSTWLFGTELKWLGAITPLGGLLFIAGWLFLFISAIKKQK
jgi:uncharacterized membrane protein YgdD (TMEM256/DUF423 family)